MIHAVIGTKAEYIKTAPVLRELAKRGVAFRIVDVGQHGGLPPEFRAPLDLPDPQCRLGDGTDAETIREVIVWVLKVSRLLFRSRRYLRRQIFADTDGVCLVHGDTPSTLLAALIGRRAGLPVAHLESGLRSHSLLHPFPEELVRVVVMRLATVFYAPSDEAVANLTRMKVRGEIVPTGGNTSGDAVVHAIDETAVTGDGPGLIAVHRVENLHRESRMDGLVQLLRLAAASGPSRFLVHPPTERMLQSSGRWDDVLAAGPSIEPLLSHGEFMEAIASARWVVTDGGSIQEECAVLGVPTLLWRGRTERPDGVGECVVLSNYDLGLTEGFFANPGEHRRDPGAHESSPSIVVADHLVALDA